MSTPITDASSDEISEAIRPSRLVEAAVNEHDGDPCASASVDADDTRHAGRTLTTSTSNVRRGPSYLTTWPGPAPRSA